MKIEPSASLRNNYNEISEYCKKTGEPIFLTKNGKGDLVVLSLEAFEEREQLLKIKEKILESKIAKSKDEKTYTLEELDEALKKIVGLKWFLKIFTFSSYDL